MLEVRSLSKSFGSTNAISAVSFAIRPGELVGLLGRNGAGKTTTLSCVAGYLKPDAGSVVISKGAKRQNRDLGFAAQDLALYPTLTVEQNIDFAGRLGGLSLRASRAATAEVIVTLGLEGFSRRRTLTLSGGQQRLVHVACALVHHPEVIVLDEPTASLDVDARAALFEYLRRLATEGAAILVSSHYVTEVEQHCKRVVVIDQGHVLMDAPIDALIAEEADTHIEISFSDHRRVIADDDLFAVLSGLTDDEQQTLQSIEVSRPSLEQIFLRLVGVRRLSEPELQEA